MTSNKKILLEFIKNYCPRDKRFFPRCLLDYFPQEIIIVARVIVAENYHYFIEDGEFIDLNTTLLERFQPTLETTIKDQLEFSENKQKRVLYQQLDKALINQLLFCSFCIGLNSLVTNEKMDLVEALLTHTVLVGRLGERIINCKVIGELRQKIIQFVEEKNGKMADADGKDEETEEEKDREDFNQPLMDSFQLQQLPEKKLLLEIKKCLQEKEVQEALKKINNETTRKKTTSDNEKSNTEKKQPPEDEGKNNEKPPYVPNINYDILLELKNLKNISKENLKKLQAFYQPYCDCEECIRRFGYEVGKDCLKIREQATQKLKEDPVKAWKKNPLLRFCLAKLIDFRVRELLFYRKRNTAKTLPLKKRSEEKPFDDKRQLEGYLEKCDECKLSFEECLERQKELQKLFIEDEIIPENLWKENPSWRACIAKTLLEKEQ
jgi:hypothetical protein